MVTLPLSVWPERSVVRGADFNKKEVTESKRIGAKPQKNSGRGKIQKGDATTEKFVIDFKFSNRSVTITEDMWQKICVDTYKTDKTKSPMLYIVLNDRTRLAVVEYDIIEELLGEE